MATDGVTRERYILSVRTAASQVLLNHAKTHAWARAYAQARHEHAKRETGALAQQARAATARTTNICTAMQATSTGTSGLVQVVIPATAMTALGTP
jgi:hypothetical protein